MRSGPLYVLIGPQGAEKNTWARPLWPPEAVAGPPAEGYLRTEKSGAGVATYLISNVGASALCGPLYEARLLKADADGLLLLGFEREGDAAVVQEWRVSPASASFKPNGWPRPGVCSSA